MFPSVELSMASVMTSTAREHVGFGHLCVGGYRQKEQGDPFGYYQYWSILHKDHYHNQLLLQGSKMVAKAGSLRASLSPSSSMPLHSEHLLQLVFSSPLCSVKNVIVIGSGWDAKYIGGNLLHLQCEVLHKCSALKEPSTASVETGLGPNNKRVENSALITKKQTSKTIPLRKRVRKKGSENSLVTQEQENERSYELNGAVRFVDKYGHLKSVQLVDSLNISSPAYAKCLECAADTTDANVNSVIRCLRNAGLSKDEIGLVLSKLPSLLKRDAVQLMNVFHLLLRLGCSEEHLCRICIRLPAILECNADEICKVVDFLQSVGLKKEELVSVLQKRPHVFSYTDDQVKASVNCLLKIGVPKEDLCRIIRKVPELFSPVIQQSLHTRLEFLVSIGLEPRALGKAIARRPNILGFNLESIKSSYRYIGHFLEGDDIAKLINRFAEVLVLDPKEKMEPIVTYLLELGVKPEDLGKVLLRRPQLLGYTIAALETTVQYLRELGVKDAAMGKVITLSPQVISLNCEEKLKPVIKFLWSAGLDQERDMEMLLVRNAQILCCSIEKNLRPKFNFFYKMGLSKRQVARIVVLFPSMFGQSIEGALMPKYNYLVNVMERSVEEIVDFPQYFGYSLEKRIRPRYEQLASRGIHTSLPSMLACIDEDFDSRYLHGNNQ
eukprot:Gb_10479 [translate_table: standard]